MLPQCKSTTSTVHHMHCHKYSTNRNSKNTYSKMLASVINREQTPSAPECKSASTTSTLQKLHWRKYNATKSTVTYLLPNKCSAYRYSSQKYSPVLELLHFQKCSTTVFGALRMLQEDCRNTVIFCRKYSFARVEY